MSEHDPWQAVPSRLHLRWSKLHALQAAILLASLVIVWLGLELAG